MKISCPSCNTVYNIPDRKIPRDKKTSARCKTCGHKILFDTRMDEKDSLKSGEIEHKGLICTYVLDGTGGGRQIDRQALRDRGSSLVWVHLERTGLEGRRWLYNESGLDRVVCDALLGDEAVSTDQWIKEVRSRVIRYKDGAAINLRGVNLNPGANPSDMVSIRT